MVCKNCGAVIDDNAANCPYCDAMNEPASVEQFNNKLDDMVDDVVEMAERPKQMLVKRSTKMLFKVMIGIVGILILVATFFAIRNVLHNREQRQRETEREEYIIWENSVFPQLDEWYEQKEFDLILEFCRENDGSMSKYSCSNWSHSYFFSIYDYYTDCRAYIENRMNEYGYREVYTGTAVYCSMKLIYDCEPVTIFDDNFSQELDAGWGLTQDELAYIEEYRQYAKELLKNHLGMSNQEIEDLYQICLDKGFVKACYDYGDEYDGM